MRAMPAWARRLAAASACAAGLLPAAAAPPPEGGAQNLEWARTIVDAPEEDIAQALAFSPDAGQLLVAGFSLPGGQPGRRAGFWLRRLDMSGEVRQEVALPSQPGQAPVARSHRYVGGLASLPGGDALVIVELGQGRPVLMRVDARGQVLFAKPIAEHSTAISRLVPGEQGRYLLVGRQGPDALVMKVDANGQAIWTRRFDRGANEAFHDVLPTDSGGFVAVGSSRSDDPAKGEWIWVLKANAEGLRQSDAVFAGREAALARGADGTYKVIYDSQPEEFAHDVWLASLDGGLQVASRVRLLDKDSGFPVRLGIAAHPRGGFVVAGAKGLGLWLQRVDAAGRPGWSWSDSPAKSPEGGELRVWHQWFEAAAAGTDALFVLSSVQRVEPSSSRTLAGLLKLGAP